MRLTAGRFGKLNMTIRKNSKIYVLCDALRVRFVEKLQEKKHLKGAFSWQGRRDSCKRKATKITKNSEFIRFSKCHMQGQGKEQRSVAMRCVFDSRKNYKKKKHLKGAFSWQGRRDSNTQPTVLETVALPLSHSPKHFECLIIISIALTIVNYLCLN